MTELAMPNERANGGKFLPGHSIKSPGRPKKEKVEEVNYLVLLRECVTADEHKAIIRRALVDAKNGSRHAREWIYSHLMPKFPRVNQYEFSLLAPIGQMSPSGVYDDEDGVADDVYRTAMEELTEDELIAVTRFNDLRRRKRLELRESAQ